MRNKRERGEEEDEKEWEKDKREEDLKKEN